MSTYYSTHRQEVLAKAKQKITCECGSIISYSSMGWHRRGQKHAIWAQMEYAKGKIEWLKEQLASAHKEHTEIVPPQVLEHSEACS
jgi:hypothetical protein